MASINDLTKIVTSFRDARDWKKFHNPKDMSLSLVLEATEVMEHFQWKTGEELDQYVRDHKEDIADELADVFYWVLLMSRDFEIDISEALIKKIEKNDQKYPVEKAKGRSTKYDKL